ncbi:hypothetical protein ACFL6X_04900 [Candidatus Latescibacterota bacterium]
MVAVVIHILVLAGLPLIAAGEVGDLQALLREQATAAQVRDSLVLERAELLERGAWISEVIDSLKVADPRSDEFREANLYALGLNHQLGLINQRVETAADRRDSLRARLRAAYDWEISRLINLLTDEYDSGLMEQLAIFEEQRVSLGFDIAASEMRYPAEMAIAEGDGPDEIDQKIEIMEDKLQMVRQEASAIEGHLLRLTSQMQMAVRMQVRILNSEDGRHGVMVDVRTGPVPEIQESERVDLGFTSTPAVRRVGQAAPGEEPATAAPALQSFQLELHALTARRQEIREMEAVLLDRISVFRERRQELLDGRE